MTTLIQRYQIQPAAQFNDIEAESLRDYFVDLIRTDGRLYKKYAIPYMMDLDKLPEMSRQVALNFMEKSRQRYTAMVGNVITNTRAGKNEIPVKMFSSSRVAGDVTDILLADYAQQYAEIKKNLDDRMTASGLTGQTGRIIIRGHGYDMYGCSLAAPYLYSSIHPVKSAKESGRESEVGATLYFDDGASCEINHISPECLVGILGMENLIESRRAVSEPSPG